MFGKEVQGGETPLNREVADNLVPGVPVSISALQLVRAFGSTDACVQDALVSLGCSAVQATDLEVQKLAYDALNACAGAALTRARLHPYWSSRTMQQSAAFFGVWDVAAAVHRTKGRRTDAAALLGMHGSNRPRKILRALNNLADAVLPPAGPAPDAAAQ